MKKQITFEQIKDTAGKALVMNLFIFLLVYILLFVIIVFTIPAITGHSLSSFPRLAMGLSIIFLVILASFPAVYFTGRNSHHHQKKILDDEIQTAQNLIKYFENLKNNFDQNIKSQKTILSESLSKNQDEQRLVYLEMRADFTQKTIDMLGRFDVEIQRASKMDMDPFEKIQFVAQLKAQREDVEERMIDLLSENQHTEEEVVSIIAVDVQKVIQRYESDQKDYETMVNVWISEYSEKAAGLEKIKQEHFSEIG